MSTGSPEEAGAEPAGPARAAAERAGGGGEGCGEQGLPGVNTVGGWREGAGPGEAGAGGSAGSGAGVREGGERRPGPAGRRARVCVCPCVCVPAPSDELGSQQRFPSGFRGGWLPALLPQPLEALGTEGRGGPFLSGLCRSSLFQGQDAIKSSLYLVFLCLQ